MAEESFQQRVQPWLMDFDDAMPCGDCCVCGEYLDHQGAGFCESCGGGFHWSQCGGWSLGEKRCDGCSEEDDEGMED